MKANYTIKGVNRLFRNVITVSKATQVEFQNLNIELIGLLHLVGGLSEAFLCDKGTTNTHHNVFTMSSFSLAFNMFLKVLHLKFLF